MSATGRGRRDGSLIPLVPPGGTPLAGSLLVVSKQSRATRLPRAGNWVRFSCSISPLFVLSHNMSMVNTTGKLASFWRFSITAGSLPSDSLANLLLPHAPRLTPHQRGQVVRGPSPLATAIHRPQNCQRPNGTRSRRAARLYSVCHRTRQFVRTDHSVSPRSPPPNR